MMTAGDVIESYVRDVAGYLPRTKRNDVAFELRTLLQDELAAKAAAQGRAPDKAMAMDLLAGFGRPAEAAARYQPRAPLIDPADNHNFLIWARKTPPSPPPPVRRRAPRAGGPSIPRCRRRSRPEWGTSRRHCEAGPGRRTPLPRRRPVLRPEAWGRVRLPGAQRAARRRSRSWPKKSR